MHSRMRTAGFTLIELAIVVVIIGILASIAVVRVGAASQRAMAASEAESQRSLQTAFDVYTGEHQGLTPIMKEDGSIDFDGNDTAARLVDGGYLRVVPTNPLTKWSCIRVEPEGEVKNWCGWVVDARSGQVVSDALK